MPRWLITALVPVAVTFGAGLIEMRVAIARLETTVSELDHRVAHIETKLDRNELAELHQ